MSTHVRARACRPLGPLLAHEHDRGRAVAEQAARDDVVHRVVVPLHGQRAELDRQQHGDLVGMPDQVVVHAGDAGRAGDAAEPEHRHPLHVLAQAEQRHEQRVDGGRRDAGDGGEDDEVDLVGRDARRVERLLQRRRREPRWPRRRTGRSSARR